VLEQQIKGQNASKGLDGGQFGPSGLKMASHGIPGKTQRIENFTSLKKSDEHCEQNLLGFS